MGLRERFAVAGLRASGVDGVATQPANTKDKVARRRLFVLRRDGWMTNSKMSPLRDRQKGIASATYRQWRSQPATGQRG